MNAAENRVFRHQDLHDSRRSSLCHCERLHRLDLQLRMTLDFGNSRVARPRMSISPSSTIRLFIGLLASGCWCISGEVATNPCLSEFFACTDGSNCVLRSFVCDGHPECNDKSDESEETCHGTLRGYRNCRDKFKCGIGLCLEDEKLVCDGKDHCPNGRDESPETCLSHPDCRNCTQLCKRHNHGATCGCNSGFELDTDGGSCIDVDECARGFCSQICHNSEGSFKCECIDGFKKVNETKCESLDKATFVWYRGDHVKGRYIILERDGREREIRIPQTIVDDHMPVSFMPSMAFDIDNDKLYIRVGNTLYSMHIETRRKTRPTLAPVLAPHVKMTDFAVDYVAGNVYFTTIEGTGIYICDTGSSCLPFISRRAGMISRLKIARLSNRAKLFWRESSRIMSANSDASEIQQVFEMLSEEAIDDFVIHEQSGKMYLASTNILEVDLSTLGTKTLTSLDIDSLENLVQRIAVLDDVVLIQVLPTEPYTSSESRQLVNRIFQFDRLTGEHLPVRKAPSRLRLHSVHHESRISNESPCSAMKCSYVCVPSFSPEAYACLCPPSTHRDTRNETCILNKKQELIYAVDGRTVSTYTFDDGKLYLDSVVSLIIAASAISTTLNDRLIFSNDQELYEVRAGDHPGEYQVRGAKAIVLDPVDNVIYVSDKSQLLALNLKTSAVAQIGNNLGIKHLDIDPVERIIYAETGDLKLHSIEIGTWQDCVLETVPLPSSDKGRTWAFDPSVNSIRTGASLVLGEGYCLTTNDDQLLFACYGSYEDIQNHTSSIESQEASKRHELLLARAGPSLGSLQKSACHESACEFCVSGGGSKSLTAVCALPQESKIEVRNRTQTQFYFKKDTISSSPSHCVGNRDSHHQEDAVRCGSFTHTSILRLIIAIPAVPVILGVFWSCFEVKLKLRRGMPWMLMLRKTEQALRPVDTVPAEEGNHEIPLIEHEGLSSLSPSTMQSHIQSSPDAPRIN